MGNGTTGSSLLLWAGLIVATGLLRRLVGLRPDGSRNPAGGFAAADSGHRRTAAAATIDIEESEATSKKKVRVSNLQAVVVRDRSISGTVDVGELKNDEVAKQEVVDTQNVSQKRPLQNELPSEGAYNEEFKNEPEAVADRVSLRRRPQPMGGPHALDSADPSWPW